MELVERALAGAQEAFRELVQRYQRPVYTLVLRMVRDPSRAEELAQDAFLKVYRKLHTYDTRRKFSSWLFKVAHNTTLDFLRKKKPDIVSLESDDLDPSYRSELQDTSAASPDETLERADLASALEAAVAELAPHYREIVLLRFGQDLAYQEIADVTGLPMGTVKVQLHRARKQLVLGLERRGVSAETLALH